MTRPSAAICCPPEQLLLYHYAELAEADHRWIEGHLSRCSACRAELAALQALLAAVPGAVPELSPKEVRDFNTRVMAHLKPRRRRWSGPLWGWALAGTVLLVLAVNLPWPGFRPEPGSVGTSLEMVSEQNLVPDLELLQDLELLENLELIQQLDALG